MRFRRLPSPAPEILIDRVAAETSAIRVGSEAQCCCLTIVRLRWSRPFAFSMRYTRAESISVSVVRLAALRWTPTRCGAIATASVTLGDDFPWQLIELLTFLRGGFPPDHPFSRILVTPAMPGAPDVWLLGSSLWSASAAAQLGLPYAFAHFIDQLPTRPAIEHYRSHFISSNGSKLRSFSR